MVGTLRSVPFPLLYFLLWSAGSGLPRQNFSFFCHFSRNCSFLISISEGMAVSSVGHHSGLHYQEQEEKKRG